MLEEKGDFMGEVLNEVKYCDTLIRVIRGDLTESDADAVVNAANSYLKHGGGVAAAIVRKGGRIIQEESNAIGFVPVGGAAMTGAGSLKARHVIHAVGPMWGEGDEEAKLKKAVISVLSLASEKGLRSIALPAISAGIFGFPKDKCASIIVNEMKHYLAGQKTTLLRIDIVLMDQGIIQFFIDELTRLAEN
ncbi:MAG: macro domain-containing protein [Syntrophorhabdaceae bacterium]